MFTLFRPIKFIREVTAAIQSLQEEAIEHIPLTEEQKKLHQLSQFVRYYKYKNEAILELNTYLLVKKMPELSDIIPFKDMERGLAVPLWSPDNILFYCMTYTEVEPSDLMEGSFRSQVTTVESEYENKKNTYVFYLQPEESESKNNYYKLITNDEQAGLPYGYRKFKRASPKETLDMLERLIYKKNKIIPLECNSVIKNYLYRLEYNGVIPHYLYRLTDSEDSYIYIAGRTNYVDDINTVLLKQQGKWQNLSVVHVSYYMDGGTTIIDLNATEGYKQVYIPSWQFEDKTPYLESSDGIKNTLVKLTFDDAYLESIGIVLNKTKLQPTPYDLDHSHAREAYHRPYTAGALAGVFGKSLPTDLVKTLSFYLDRKTGAKLAQTCKQAATNAKEAMEAAEPTYERYKQFKL